MISALTWQKMGKRRIIVSSTCSFMPVNSDSDIETEDATD